MRTKSVLEDPSLNLVAPIDFLARKASGSSSELSATCSSLDEAGSWLVFVACLLHRATRASSSELVDSTTDPDTCKRTGSFVRLGPDGGTLRPASLRSDSLAYADDSVSSTRGRFLVVDGVCRWRRFLLAHDISCLLEPMVFTDQL